ncbi:FAD/NAD(P)-binding protein [Neorhizobium sp. BT27B]|uniref:FAD/NAD(P)-binding protein n=1 Tax=Neorhizobium sp. BT27B TaxID=3142625 RepID=UPI003D29A2AD
MKIAIIGCGYGGAVVLNRLLDRYGACATIDVYDEKGSVGRGYAYQADDGSNLLNRPASLMYFSEKGDFRRWLGSNSDEYVARGLFGDFVNYSLTAAVARSCRAPRFLKERVISVEETVEGVTVTARTPRSYDAAILATGNEAPNDAYGLSGLKGFISDPYPTSQFKQSVGSEVAILGTRLSAIDAAVAILDRDDGRRVTLYSRKSALPLSSDTYEHISLVSVSEELLRGRASDRGLKLTEVARIIDREFEAQDAPITVGRMLRSTAWQRDENLKRRIYSILASMNNLAPIFWGSLATEEALRFKKIWSSVWNAARVPVPPQKRELVDTYMASGRLVVRQGLQSVEGDDGGFTLQTRQGTFSADLLVNATGPSSALSSPLYSRMFESGAAEPHEFGGLRIDVDTCRVIGKRASSSLFSLGHPTAGAFFSVSNIDIIQTQAHRIANEIGKLTIARGSPFEHWGEVQGNTMMFSETGPTDLGRGVGP